MKARIFSVIVLLAALLLMNTFFSPVASADGLRTAGLILDTDGKTLLVKGVIKDSPAFRAGISKGDVITAYRLGENGKEMIVARIKPANSFTAITRQTAVMTLKISRGGEEKEFTLTPDEMTITPALMPSGLPSGKVTNIKRSVLFFTVDLPDEVVSEDEFLVFKGDEFICKTKIRREKGELHTYGLRLPLAEVNGLGDAKLIFYNHIVSYFIKKQIAK